MKRRISLLLMLVLLSASAGVIIIELLASLVLPGPPQGYCIFPPGYETVLHPSKGIMPGVTGPSIFRVNAMGLRGEDFPAKTAVNFLVIGGSTAECLYLDQTETWPALLSAMLQNSTGTPVWIGNGGKSGANTNHHILQLQELSKVEKFDDIHHIILLIGINDLSMYLANPDGYLHPTKESAYKKAFSIFPNKALPLIKRTRSWKGLKKIKQQVAGDEFVQNADGSIYTQWRNNRRNAHIILDTLPDLSPALAHYRNNIAALLDLAENHQKQITFLTQPVMWRDSLPEYLQHLLWMGGIGRFMSEGPHTYYSSKALRTGMDAFNSELIRIGGEHEIRVVDIAASLPADTTVFYDDCHFNESGARLVAKAVKDHFAGIAGTP